MAEGGLKDLQENPTHKVQRSSLQSAKSQLENSLLEGGVQHIKQVAAQTKKQKEEGLLKIQKQKEQVHKDIDNHYDKLSSDINTTFHKFIQDVKQSHAHECQRLNKWLNESTDVDIIKASLDDKNNIEGTIQQLTQNQKQSKHIFNVHVNCLPLSSFGVELDIKCHVGTRTVVASYIKRIPLAFRPAGITCTPDGRIIVCQNRGTTVTIYSSEGKELFDLNTPKCTRAWDVECTPTNIYVTDDNHTVSESVLVFNHDRGNCATRIKIDNVREIAGISLLSYDTTLMYITGDGSGTVHVARSQADSLELTSNAFCDASFDSPRFVCAKNKSVAISSYSDHSVHVSDLNGKLQYSFGTPGHHGTGPNELYSPTGVVFDSENRLLIANYGSNRITVLSDTGDYLGEIELKKDDAGFMGIAINEHGQLLVASETPQAVTTYTYSFE